MIHSLFCSGLPSRPRLEAAVCQLAPGGHALIRTEPVAAVEPMTMAEVLGLEIRDVITHLMPGRAELWILARKKLAKKHTVAKQVLATGTGALNIGACKIPVGAWGKTKFPAGIVTPPGIENTYGGGGLYADRPRPEDKDPDGRWPTNLLISHSEHCIASGTTAVKGNMGVRGKGRRVYGGGLDNSTGQIVGYAGPDGKEAVVAWTCATDCPVAEMDRQSAAGRGAARYFQQFQSPAEVWGWLLRLTTARGGGVLHLLPAEAQPAEVDHDCLLFEATATREGLRAFVESNL